MSFKLALLSMILTVILFSCKKEYGPNAAKPSTEPPNIPAKHVLLKDITIPNLPSPYYHFEYNADSMVTKANFASGFSIYDIIYEGNKIDEMRNNIFVNHDTLRYYYDTGNKVSAIDFINEDHVTYGHAFLNYQGDQVKEIWWNHLDAHGDFGINRILTFTSYPNGNVKSITEQRRADASEPWHLNIKTFENYDGGINVDDFSLIHDGIHDHLLLLQGFRLQKNNPRKETFTSDGVDLYTVNYTYVYNSDHTPSTKTGDLLYTGGPDNGKRFTTNSIYSYY